MTDRLPPNPTAFRSLAEWANQLYEYQLAQTRITGTVDPEPVLLAHRVGDERAAVAGILLYDPVSDEQVVSKDGTWVAVTTLPSYTATQIADAAHEVNTLNKSVGRVVYDSTNDTVVVANGSGTTDTWSRLTVAATVTPS